MLEDLGLRVLEELSTRLTGEEDEVWVQEFRVLGPDGAPLDVDGRAASGVAEVIAAVWRGDAESDPLNRLVVTAGLDRRQLADPARLPQVPPAGRLALHRGLPERRAGGQLAR